MKAWIVEDRTDDYNACTIIFAETRGQAKELALYTDTCGDSEFINIRARRVPALDWHYKGYPEMDWDRPEDRRAMIKHTGMRCSDEMSLRECECENCSGKEFCSRYQDQEEV